MIVKLPARPEVLEMLTIIVEARNERDWRDSAACKGMDPNIFFPTRGGHNTLGAARTVCASCTVRTQCYEVARTEYTGVWAGTSANQRRNQGTHRISFENQYRQWIINTEPSEEVAAHDLGIQIESVQRSRLRSTRKETT